MKNARKLKAAGLIIVFLLGIIGLKAQDVTTVKAMTEDISSNLDLEAVASIFGDANDLEDFEKQLNDPDLQISNLDLNLDGYVDYLRVVEITEANTHLIAIQAVLGDDLYQDVATIEVERDQSGKTYVQVVGDVYMYGPDYIIEPVYVHVPVFFSYFWRPYYRPYWSPYYWGYYPVYYRHWHPCYTHVYRSHVRVYVNVHHFYHHVSHRRSHVAIQLHKKYRRNDFGRKYPSRSYVIRNRSTQNNTALASRGTVNRTGRIVEKRAVENRTSGSDNSNLRAQRSTKPTQRGEISRSGSNTRVEQNRKATSTVNRSNRSARKTGKSHVERTSRKNVSNKAIDYRPRAQKANNTKQRSYSKRSNTSKSHQAKSHSVKPTKRSITGNSQSKVRQSTSKSRSTTGNISNRKNTRSR